MSIIPVSAALQQAGQSLWLDYLSRSFIDSGQLADAVAHQRITGVTSNPAIFAQALGSDTAYQQQLAELQQLPPADRLLQLAITDARQACRELQTVYTASHGRDGFVSLELDPYLAHDTIATVAQAREIWQAVAEPNLMVKVPATPAGVHALAQLIGEGINVNATLIFSVVRYREVLQAFYAGLEAARDAGLEIARISSVASIFVSRFDAAVAAQLAASTSIASSLRERLSTGVGVANAALCYQIWQQQQNTARANELQLAGAQAQRPLWASTGVKNSALPASFYAVQLAAPHTVNTLAPATLQALQQQSVTADSLAAFDFAASHALLDELAAHGVDYTALTETLLQQGLTQFCAAWDTLRAAV